MCVYVACVRYALRRWYASHLMRMTNYMCVGAYQKEAATDLVMDNLDFYPRWE